MGIFERYLSVWVGLGIIAGVGLGNLMPSAFTAVAELQVANVNLVVAVLIWVMLATKPAWFVSTPEAANEGGTRLKIVVIVNANEAVWLVPSESL